MLDKGVVLEERDLGKQPLSEAELDALIGNRSHLDFLNPRNALYQEKNMKEKPPSRVEALRLMAREPNLIRRPLVAAGGKVIPGFDPGSLEELLG